MTLPKKWLQGGLFVIKEHMRAARLGKVGKIVDFLLTVEKNPLGFAGFNCVILADSKSLPYYLADYHSYLQKIHSVSILVVFHNQQATPGKEKQRACHPQ